MIKMAEKSYSLGVGSWMFIQCALLVIHYGFNKTLPLWVLWFPTISGGAVIIIALLILIIILVKEWLDF